jgi:hypothetical protein
VFNIERSSCCAEGQIVSAEGCILYITPRQSPGFIHQPFLERTNGFP